jgi:hypothetical protein
MASPFDALAALDNGAFFGMFGETTRIPVVTGGVSRTILGIVLRETRRSVEVGGFSNTYNAMDIYISAADNVDGITAPKEVRTGQTADVYTIDGHSWVCQRVLENNIGGMHKLELWDGGT